jgi:hypothetical protein
VGLFARKALSTYSKQEKQKVSNHICLIAVLENHDERAALRTRMKLAIFLSLIGASAAINANRADVAPLILEQSIPLPGVKGKFDHLAIDLVGQRVFVAGKANDTLEVVDLKNGSRLRSVTGSTNRREFCTSQTQSRS